MTIHRGRHSLAGPLIPFVVPLIFLTPAPAASQGSDRIWGRVEILSGEVHEGFIRWDRNEGSWADLLNGTKDLPDLSYRIWNESADSAEVVPDRVIELEGVRITFPDTPTDQVVSADSGIRFGHIHRLIATGDQGAELFLRSGETTRLSEGSTDLGTDLREIEVRTPGQRAVVIGWGDLKLVEFRAAPASAAPLGRRLHGTVEDRKGNRYTGYLAWDTDKILSTDTLVGEDSGGRDREISFDQIVSVRPNDPGATVTLIGGEAIRLFDSEHVTPDNDGIQISDPGLGQVEVAWTDLESARFHPPERATRYSAFDGGHALRGTIVTASGKELTGRIRWDADEEYSWEILDGVRDGVVFDVEFGMVSHIERFAEVGTEIESVNVGFGVRVEARTIRGVRIKLLDGRVLELEGSNDVNDENKGILVLLDGEEGESTSDEPAWIMVRWEDFRELLLDHGGRE